MWWKGHQTQQALALVRALLLLFELNPLPHPAASAAPAQHIAAPLFVLGNQIVTPWPISGFGLRACQWMYVFKCDHISV